jgi:hypothetical protein
MKIVRLNNFGDVSNVGRFIGRVISGKMRKKSFKD